MLIPLNKAFLFLYIVSLLLFNQCCTLIIKKTRTIQATLTQSPNINCVSIGRFYHRSIFSGTLFEYVWTGIDLVNDGFFGSFGHTAFGYIELLWQAISSGLNSKIFNHDFFNFNIVICSAFKSCSNHDFSWLRLWSFQCIL